MSVPPGDVLASRPADRLASLSGTGSSPASAATHPNLPATWGGHSCLPWTLGRQECPPHVARLLWFSRRLVPVDALAGRRVGHEVHLAPLVLAERQHWHALVRNRPIGDDALLPLVVFQRPVLVGDIVGVQVMTLEFGHALPAVHRPTGDRLADVVVVLPDGLDVLGPRAGPLGSERV